MGNSNTNDLPALRVSISREHNFNKTKLLTHADKSINAANTSPKAKHNSS